MSISVFGKIKNRIFLRSVRWGGSFFLYNLNRIFPKWIYPIPTVTVVLDKGDKILALKRSDGLGNSLPGGIIRWGESPREAAKREVYEETGYEIGKLRLLKVYSNIPHVSSPSVVNLVYVAKIVGGKMRSSSEGKPCWLLLRDFLKEYKFGTKEVVKDYLTKQYPFEEDIEKDFISYIEKLKYLCRAEIRKFVRWCGNNLEIKGPVLDLGSGYRNNRPELDPKNVLDYKTLDLNADLGPDYVGDAQNISKIEDNTFGTIVCTELIEHVEEPKKVISESARILKEGGLFIFTVPFWMPIHEKDYQKDYWRFTPRGIKYLLQSHFKDILTKTAYDDCVPTNILGYAFKK